MNFALLLTFKLTTWYSYFGKSCKTKLFRKSTGVSQNTPKFILIGSPINKITVSYKYEKFVAPFWRLLFHKTNCWHLESLMNQIFGQRFIIFEKLRYMGQLLLKLLAVEVATSADWISSRSTFNNKHTKIAVNSEIRYFEGCSQNKYLLKVWSFLVNPLQNGGPVKFLRN